ncbi:WD40-repeat-containing domain protein [Crepidotus variabilis]|uniref:WD40-repeat-containing domain protein n=1 Tax=Crepidotus variabilis TaxID=179855 RepID=A0A9P6EAI5_9AGAR|nr:WD40-repeat-containing domain protein [Crepidotus variabilis]
MPDPFFSSSKPRKRKRSDGASHMLGAQKLAKTSRDTKQPKSSKKATRDEELSDRTDEDIEDMDLRADEIDPGASGDEDDNETPAEKRLRLAQLYLESVKTSLVDGEYDAAEIDRELISARLKQDVLEHSGKVHRFIADSFDFSTAPSSSLRTTGHRYTVTSAAASGDGNYLFTCGKEGHIFKWDLMSGKKLGVIYKARPSFSQSSADKKGKGKAKDGSVKQIDLHVKGHTDEVLSLAISGDDKFLASSGKDRRVCVWDVETCEWRKTFGGYLGHKDSVVYITFKKGSNQLYTASLDRTIKIYDLSPSVMGYVETVFGHQDHVLGLDALRGEGCVSVGSRDKTMRYWKIVDGKQVVYRGGGKSRMREVLEGDLGAADEGEDREEPRKETEKQFVEGSLECVAMIDEATFISGGDSGTISLFTSQRRKPIFKQPLAHGLNQAPSESEGVIETPRWITSLATLRYSDLFASGSWEGDIRIWKLDARLKSFSLVGTVPAPGFVNSLQFLPVSKDFLEKATWVRHSIVSDSDIPNLDRKDAKRDVSAHPFVLVAATGQEPRLGRWLSVKEGGAKNSAYVWAFNPRTT